MAASTPPKRLRPPTRQTQPMSRTTDDAATPDGTDSTDSTPTSVHLYRTTGEIAHPDTGIVVARQECADPGCSATRTVQFRRDPAGHPRGDPDGLGP